MSSNCILCHSDSQIFFQDTKYNKDYYACTNCDLKFMHPKFYVSREEETYRYNLHENNPADMGYQAYLQPVRDIVINKFDLNKSRNSPIQLLDFGSGAHSALVPLFDGLPVRYTAYDPLYKDDKAVFDQTYDAVVMTEVVEHLKAPTDVFSQLKKITRKKGYIIVMTQFYSSHINFKDWHYRRDPTHISFYSRKTMEYIKNQLGFADLDLVGERLACFKL